MPLNLYISAYTIPSGDSITVHFSKTILAISFLVQAASPTILEDKPFKIGINLCESPLRISMWPFWLFLSLSDRVCRDCPRPSWPRGFEFFHLNELDTSKKEEAKSTKSNQKH